MKYLLPKITAGTGILICVDTMFDGGWISRMTALRRPVPSQFAAAALKRD